MNDDRLHEKIADLLQEANPEDVKEAELLWQGMFAGMLTVDCFMSAGQVTDTLDRDNPYYDILGKSYVGLHWLTHPALIYEDEDASRVPKFTDILSGAVTLAVRRHAYDPFNQDQIKNMVLEMLGATASLVTLMVVTATKSMDRETKRIVGKRIAAGLSEALNKELAMYVKEIGEMN